MKILYIHGLDSSPNPDRIGWLEQEGHQVEALHLDSRNEPDTYNLLRKVARQCEFIVGSSLGGRLGYWLAEELGLPCLLYNPALALEIPGLSENHTGPIGSPERYVVLGDLDDVVDPEETWKWLRMNDSPNGKQRVIRCQWLGHQIDQQTYIQTCRWAGLSG